MERLIPDAWFELLLTKSIWLVLLSLLVSFVVLLNTQQESEDSVDDEYAEYEIPDDLMW